VDGRAAREAFGNAALQNRSLEALAAFFINESQSEDCLF
jgi:hypothetical protein